MKLCLDYDHCSYDFVWRELFRLKVKFNVPLQVWETRPGSYHIRSIGHVPENQAWQIMDNSLCSNDYKELCRKHGNMPFRLSGKVEYDERGARFVNPPSLLFELP